LTNGEGKLPECLDCREEFTKIQETLRTTRRQLESVLPSDKFFQNYHLQLRQRLENVESAVIVKPTGTSRFQWVSRILNASIRIPVPVAVLLLIALGTSLIVFRRTMQKEPEVPRVSVVHVPVEVPVIQEKVVTKVVYRRQRSNNVRANPVVSDSTYAKSQKRPSLVGFKPLDEVKLTIIKGGLTDEK
jgi:hypothetical protein